MSLTVPPDLRWIFVLLAGDMWPALDEDKLRELAQICQSYAVDLGRATDGLDSLVTNVLDSSHGSVGRAFLRYGYQLDQYGQSFPGTAEAMAKTLDDYALQGESAKYSMLIATAFTAAEVLWALSTPFTAGLVPSFIAASRAAVVRFTERFFGRVGSILARAALEEAAQEVVEAGLAQLIQGIQGHRHAPDWMDLGLSAGLGAGAGLFASSLQTSLARWVKDRAGGHFNSDSLGRAAFVDAATELAVGIATLPLGGDPSSLWMGPLNGVATSAVQHKAEHLGQKWSQERQQKRDGYHQLPGDDIPLESVPDTPGPPPPPGGAPTTGSGTTTPGSPPPPGGTSSSKSTGGPSTGGPSVGASGGGTPGKSSVGTPGDGTPGGGSSSRSTGSTSGGGTFGATSSGNSGGGTSSGTSSGATSSGTSSGGTASDKSSGATSGATSSAGTSGKSSGGISGGLLSGTSSGGTSGVTSSGASVAGSTVGQGSPGAGETGIEDAQETGPEPSAQDWLASTVEAAGPDLGTSTMDGHSGGSPDQTADALVQRWNHFPMEIGNGQAGPTALGAEREAAVQAVKAELSSKGFAAAEVLAKAQGAARGVQPWTGALGGVSPSPTGTTPVGSPATASHGPALQSLQDPDFDATVFAKRWDKLPDNPRLAAALETAQRLVRPGTRPTELSGSFADLSDSDRSVARVAYHLYTHPEQGHQAYTEANRLLGDAHRSAVERGFFRGGPNGEAEQRSPSTPTEEPASTGEPGRIVSMRLVQDTPVQQDSDAPSFTVRGADGTWRSVRLADGSPQSGGNGNQTGGAGATLTPNRGNGSQTVTESPRPTPTNTPTKAAIKTVSKSPTKTADRATQDRPAPKREPKRRAQVDAPKPDASTAPMVTAEATTGPAPTRTEAQTRETPRQRSENRELAWQAWLTQARSQRPGTVAQPVDLTWAQVTERIDRHVEQAVREAAGTYWQPFDTDAHRDYVNFHGNQARDHAWDMVLHDLGIDTSNTEDSPERPERPQRPHVVTLGTPNDTVLYRQAAAAVPRAVGWTTLIGHFKDGAVADGDTTVRGEALLDRTENPSQPVVMVVCNAAAPPQTGPSPAAELHAASNQRVLAPTGEAMMSPDGDVLSGTWTVDDELNVLPVANGDWVVFENGEARSLGTASLTEALAALGVDTVPGGPAPTAPVGFFQTITPQQRAALTTLGYRTDDLAGARPPASFYDALLDVARDPIARILGHDPTEAEVRALVAEEFEADLRRPSAHYRGLVASHQNPQQLAVDLRRAGHWDGHAAALVPHVAADLFGLDLGVIGTLGRADAVGDLNGPRGGDANGDPFVLVNLADRYAAARPDPASPRAVRELRPRHVPGAATPWTAPLTTTERALVHQAGQEAPLPPGADRQATATATRVTLERLSSRLTPPTPDSDLANRVRTALQDWDGAATANTLAELRALERVAVAATPDAQAATELTRWFDATFPAPTAQEIERAHRTAELVALAQQRDAIRQARADTATGPPPDGITALLGGARTRATDAAQAAFDARVNQAVNAVPPVRVVTGDGAEALNRAEEIRYRNAVATARRDVQPGARNAYTDAFAAAIDDAVNGPELAGRIDALATAAGRERFAEHNADTVRDAIGLGDEVGNTIRQRAQDAAATEARTAAEWRIRQNNALDGLVAVEPPRHLPPGFAEPGPDGTTLQYPMGRGGRFIRLGNTRFSDFDGIAAQVENTLPAGDRWRVPLRAAVLAFLAEHGSHTFGQRALEGGIPFGLTDGGDHEVVTVRLGLGDRRLIDQPVGLATEVVPIGEAIGQRQHNAVEADHESTSGSRNTAGSSRKLGVSSNIGVPFGNLPKNIWSASLGTFGLSGSSSVSYSAGSDAVSATKRLFPLSGASAYFDFPGATLTAQTAAGAIHSSTHDVRLAFSSELTPLRPRGRADRPVPNAPIALNNAPVRGVTTAELDAEAALNGPRHRAAERVAAVPHNVMHLAERIAGLPELRNAIHTELARGVDEADPKLAEGVEFFLSEASFLRMSSDIMGPGSTSPLFTGTQQGRQMHLTVQAKLRTAQAVSIDPVPLKEESQRFLNFADGQSQGGGMSFAPPLNGKFSLTIGDPKAPQGGNSSFSFGAETSAALSSGRSMNANSGSGHISGLVYNGQSVRYRAVMRMRVEIARPGTTAATVPTVERDVVVYLRVPLHQQARFEALLADAALDAPTNAAPPADVDPTPIDPDLSAADQAAEQAERDRDREPPLPLAAGRGTGFTAINNLAGGQRVLPRIVELVHQAGERMPWSRLWDPMETAYLRTQLASRYTEEGLKNWSGNLFQPGGVRMQLFRPAKEGTEVITVTVRGRQRNPQPTARGRVASAKLELMPSAFAGTGGGDTLDSELGVTGKIGGSIGVGTDRPLRSVAPEGKWAFGRKASEGSNVGASGFMLEAILYDGPVRTFDYDVALDIDVEVRHDCGLLAIGWPSVAATLGYRAATHRNPLPSLSHSVNDTVDGSARFVIVERLAPAQPATQARLDAAGAADVHRFPGQDGTVTRPDVGTLLNNSHTPLNPDDQVMEVLNGEAVGNTLAELLTEVGIDRDSYGVLPWTITGGETLASSLVRGPSVIAQTVVDGGEFHDRHAVVTIEGFPFNPRTDGERIPIFQMHVAEGNGQVSASRSTRTSHVWSFALNFGFLDHEWTNGASASSSLTFGYNHSASISSASSSSGVTMTTGRLTQGTRDYVEHTADMLWRVTVVAHSASAPHTGNAQSAHAVVEVTEGVSFLRLADPVPDPRNLTGPAPQAPAGTPQQLRAVDNPGTGAASLDRIPTMPATPGSTTRLPSVPLVPATAAPERLLPLPAAGRPRDVTGEGNPVLDEVQRLLQENAPELLEANWTVDNGGGPTHQVPATLRNLLNVGSLEALIDVMLGPGLVLHGIRSLPLANERVQIVLRATRDPNNQGYTFLQHVESTNVSRYWFRYNTSSQSAGTESSQGGGIDEGNTINPVHTDRFDKIGFGPSHSGSESNTKSSSKSTSDAVRDTYFYAGPADRYAGQIEITATLTRTYLPSRLVNTALLGLPAKVAGLVQHVGDQGRDRPSVTIPMIERVLIPTELVRDDTQPTVTPGAAAVTEVVPGTTAAALGVPLNITPQQVLEHRALSHGFDHAKVRVLFEQTLARLSGNTAPLSGQRSFAVGRLADAGTRAQDALHYLLSYGMFTRQLEFMLRPEGFTPPRLLREGGPFTDTTGELNLRVELLNPQVRGYNNGWLETVDYGFAEFNQGRGQSYSHETGFGATPTQISGDTGDQDPGSSRQQSPAQGPSVTAGRSRGRSAFGVLKTMPRSVAKNTKVPRLRVASDALVHITLDARNTRDWIDLPGGQVTMSFHVRNAAEFGLTPEVALGLGLQHPSGLPVPSGIFVAAHDAAAHGVADDGTDSLRAAFGMPEIPGTLAVHVRLDAQGSFIVGNRALTAADFAREVLGNVDLDGRTLILVTGDGDSVPAGRQPGDTPAAALAAATGRPVIAADGDVHITPDGTVLAVRLGRAADGGPSLRDWTNGRWSEVLPPGQGPSTAQHTHDLRAMVEGLGFQPGARPSFVPPPSRIVSRGRCEDVAGPVPAVPPRVPADTDAPPPRRPVEDRLRGLFPPRSTPAPPPATSSDAQRATPSWQAASDLVQRWNHYPMAMAEDPTGQARVDAERDAAIQAVHTRMTEQGYEAAEALAKEQGAARGVQPWAGGFGGAHAGTPQVSPVTATTSDPEHHKALASLQDPEFDADAFAKRWAKQPENPRFAAALDTAQRLVRPGQRPRQLDSATPFTSLSESDQAVARVAHHLYANPAPTAGTSPYTEINRALGDAHRDAVDRGSFPAAVTSAEAGTPLPDQASRVLALAGPSTTPRDDLAHGLTALQLQNVATLLDGRPNQGAANLALFSLAEMVALGQLPAQDIGTVIDIMHRHGLLDAAFTGTGMSRSEFIDLVTRAVRLLDPLDPEHQEAERYLRDQAERRR